jgi:hypothetical protein
MGAIAHNLWAERALTGCFDHKSAIASEVDVLVQIRHCLRGSLVWRVLVVCV